MWNIKVIIIPIEIETVSKDFKRGTNQDHPDNSIVVISQNIEKNHKNLRRRAVTQKRNSPYRFEKETRRVGNLRMNQDHPDNSIVVISQNIEKNHRIIKT